VAKFPGIGGRVADRLRARGYWKHDRPDVRRFCRELGYRPQYVYAWLQDRTPGFDNLRRLSRDLEVPVAWLVAGDGRAGGPAVAMSPRRPRGAATAVVDAMPAVVDVSLLRDAADRIVAIKADLDAALGAFPLPCLWVDASGRVLGVHGVADPTLPRALIGRTLRDALPAEAASTLHRALAQALTVNLPVAVDCPMPTSLGRRVYEVRVGAVATPSRPRRAFVVVEDVTERRARESQYRQLVEGSPNGLCIHRDYTILFANHAMARLFGYARGTELNGRDIRSLLPDHVEQDPSGSRIRPRKPSEGVTRTGGRVRVTVLVSTVVWSSAPATLVTVTSLAHAGGGSGGGDR
jgi:PAS domain S-box-containing protein